MNYILLIIFNSLCWALCPHIDKHILKSIKPEQFWLLTRSVINFSVGILIFLFFLVRRKKITDHLPSKSSTVWKYAILVTIIANVALFINYYLIKRIKITEFITIQSPLAVVLTVLIGCCFFKEKINHAQQIGAVLSVLGMYIIIKNSEQL